MAGFLFGVFQLGVIYPLKGTVTLPGALFVIIKVFPGALYMIGALEFTFYFNVVAIDVNFAINKVGLYRGAAAVCNYRNLRSVHNHIENAIIISSLSIQNVTSDRLSKDFLHTSLSVLRSRQ